MQNCYSCMQHSALTCSINRPSITEIFLTVADMAKGRKLEKCRYADLTFLQKQSALICSINLPSIIDLFRMVAE